MVSSLMHTGIVACFFTLCYLLCLQEHVVAIEIIIGGGPAVPSPDPDDPECSPPPPPPEPLCPPPSSPAQPSPYESPPPPPPHPPLPPPRKSHPLPPPRSSPYPRRSPYFPFLNSNIKRDHATIQAFKRTIEFDPFNVTGTWHGPNVCETYKGFLCDKLPPLYKDHAVAGINFNGFNLGGRGLTLDGYVDRMLDLAIIHVNSNNFTGRVPRGIANLKYLYELDLSNNKYEGHFPNEVLGAKNLIFLDLRFNAFCGTVPPQVFNLPLLVLFINNNNFAQKLPDNLGDNTAAYQTYAYNKFTGPIPSSIGKSAKTLREVLYLNNQLSGCLPYQIGLLKYATVFDVSFNQLRGPIPWSFGCLSKMEILVLARNQFSGCIPDFLCTLPYIRNLSLSYNYYTEIGAECRKSLSRNILDVKMNCIIDLPNQRSKTDCFNFFNSKMPPCPDPKSLFYIPCGQHYASNGKEVESLVSNSAFPAPSHSPSALTSYDYLSPQTMH